MSDTGNATKSDINRIQKKRKRERKGYNFTVKFLLFIFLKSRPAHRQVSKSEGLSVP